MFNIEPKGFPYSLQVALQMRKMHHMFLGKNRAEKHVNRSFGFIVEAIKAETENNLPDVGHYPNAKWRKECVLLQNLIQEALTLIRYSLHKTFKPLCVVYRTTTPSAGAHDDFEFFPKRKGSRQNPRQQSQEKTTSTKPEAGFERLGTVEKTL